MINLLAEEVAKRPKKMSCPANPAITGSLCVSLNQLSCFSQNLSETALLSQFCSEVRNFED